MSIMRNVSQVNSNNKQMASELNEFKEMIEKMLVEHVNGIKVCELCGFASHKTYECLILQNDDIVDINVTS